ncbi:unnamed protein product [Pleuronectes platessa]|uniref:Uncharacterized protein n=1 Tax=Pleuronectes platessa TaxID=8262 RepID=A0A9N7TQJ7_PLEPL|nr:unnamed protein product [Pleuronectes platessa]
MAHTSSELRAISWFQRPSLTPPMSKPTTPVPFLNLNSPEIFKLTGELPAASSMSEGQLQSVEGMNGPNRSDVMPSCPVHLPPLRVLLIEADCCPHGCLPGSGCSLNMLWHPCYRSCLHSLIHSDPWQPGLRDRASGDGDGKTVEVSAALITHLRPPPSRSADITPRRAARQQLVKAEMAFH